MKITFDIPDSYADQRLTLIAGIKEWVAGVEPGESIGKVKVVRCNFCGACCMDIDHPDWAFPVDGGKCSKLVKTDNKWMCTAKYNTPVRCIPDPLKENSPDCCIEYREQKVR